MWSSALFKNLIVISRLIIIWICTSDSARVNVDQFDSRLAAVTDYNHVHIYLLYVKKSLLDILL